jgi:hypothetical protein
MLEFIDLFMENYPIYYTLPMLFSGVITFMLVVSSILGAGLGDVLEIDFFNDADDDGAGYFSVRAIIYSFLLFSLVGVRTDNIWYAVLAFFATYAITIGIMFLMKKLESSGTMKNTDLIGKVATVDLPIKVGESYGSIIASHPKTKVRIDLNAETISINFNKYDKVRVVEFVGPTTVIVEEYK